MANREKKKKPLGGFGKKLKGLDFEKMPPWNWTWAFFITPVEKLAKKNQIST